ncbi:hypothetical protein SDC9_18498 [bioreactor metagenome]|uniref:Uncharacterized protein n=1 Tax=bioreactor metagenome TaxID=1076179 RepID=A0A644U0F4_9ZZZZ|nr:hypothetical protein [Methanocorpusculum sp.]
MPIVEVQLNRLGINSLEVSADSVEVSVGTPLHIRIVNFGAPTHATLRTEGSAYTNFTYENLYVEAESEIKLDILPTANPGSFEVQVISGYGMRRSGFTVNVILPELEEKTEPVCTEPVQKPARRDPLSKMGWSVTLINLIAPILGFIVLIFWIQAPAAVNTTVMAVILYIIMLAGIIITWRSVQ